MVEARFHKIQKHIIGDIAPRRLSGSLVKREMDSAIDAASIFFVRHRRKTRIRARRVARTFPNMFKTNVVEQAAQAEEMTKDQLSRWRLRRLPHLLSIGSSDGNIVGRAELLRRELPV